MKNILCILCGLIIGCAPAVTKEDAAPKKEPHIHTTSQYLPEVGGYGTIKRVVTDEEYQEELMNSPVLAASEQMMDPSYKTGTTVMTDEDIAKLAKERKALIDRPDAL